jgi:HK97 family phage prohead protease
VNTAAEARRLAAVAARRSLTQTEKASPHGLTWKSLPATAPISTDPQGRAVFVANSTNVVDRQGDNILPNAWAPVLGSKPKILIGHEHTALPVGKVLNLRELMPGSYELPQWHQQNHAGALIAEAQFNLESVKGREAFSAIKGGYADSFSVGFLSDGERYVKGVREVTRITDLAEISLVLMPASPGTQVLAVKGRTAYAPRESSDLPFNDLIVGIVAEELTNATFRQDARTGRETRIEKGIDENPEILIAAARIRLSHLRPSDPQAVNLRQWIDNTERRLAQGKHDAAQAQRMQEIQTMFGVR